jgi:ferredoxin/flavodoxin---NADP+ reductase
MTESDDMKIGTEERPLRVAIVGSGPSGFYAADALLTTQDLVVHVDMFDRLPTPYGLVRGGVAPDHQKIKSVVKVYERSAENPHFRFFGNVLFGRDILVGDLTKHYDQIVYAVGNESDRRLGIPGEYLVGVCPATVFVGWYNGHPDYRDANFDFSGKRVVVVGNGNVAIDVARILSLTTEELAKTDVADYALEALGRSGVEEITMLGRRGPVQAAFTPTEAKELGNLSQTDPVIPCEELDLDPFSSAELEREGEKSRKGKNMALLRAYCERGESTKPRKIRFRFFVSPVKFLGDEDGNLQRIRLVKNELYQEREGSIGARSTEEFEEIEADMALVAIGYQGTPLPGVPFDEKKRILSNTEGRISQPGTGKIVPNQYVVGWARSGPWGLIGSHKAASAEVATHMIEDLVKGVVPERELPPLEAIPTFFEERGIDCVSFDDWKMLDDVETHRGQRRGSPRVKFTDVGDMLSVLGIREEIQRR